VVLRFLLVKLLNAGSRLGMRLPCLLLSFRIVGAKSFMSTDIVAGIAESLYNSGEVV